MSCTRVGIPNSCKQRVNASQLLIFEGKRQEEKLFQTVCRAVSSEGGLKRQHHLLYRPLGDQKKAGIRSGLVFVPLVKV